MHLVKNQDLDISSVAKGPISTTTSLPPILTSNLLLNGVAHTAEQTYIQDVVSKIIDSYELLASLPSLEPSTVVNQAFGRLVDIAIRTPREDVADKILTHPDIARITPHLQEICSNGEYELEKFWANRIAGASSEKEAKNLLANFTYYENYIDLTRLELNAIATATPRNSPPPRRIAFIGSGPLPLSSLCMLSALQSQNSPLASPDSEVFIENIDRDPTAISLSSALCQKLCIPPTTMAFSCYNATESTQSLTSFDVVFLAALVGRSEKEKKGVIGNVVGRMGVGGLLVVRSAHSLRRLLYPAVGVDMGMEMVGEVGFRPVVVVHPCDHVVNSVVVGRVVKVGLV